jgi:hypothetical protein
MACTTTTLFLACHLLKSFELSRSMIDSNIKINISTLEIFPYRFLSPLLQIHIIRLLI